MLDFAKARVCSLVDNFAVYLRTDGAMLWLLLREFLIQFAGQLMDVGGLAKPLNLKGRGFNVDARVLAELLQHLEHHGELLFGEHTDLKIKMRAPLCLASHAILADEHKDGQEYAL